MKLRLANGCSCSQPKVSPTSWERSNASIKSNWYVHYRFYDPLFAEKYPDGKQIQIKGINAYKTVRERQEAAKVLLQTVTKLLTEQAYNPITGNFIELPPESDFIGNSDYPIPPDTGLSIALEKGLERMDIVPEYRINLTSTLKYVKQAIEQLRMRDMPVKNVRRRHVVMILEQCGRNKKIWTAATYNRYRHDLRGMFRELVIVEALEFNPVDEYLPLKKGTESKKEVLTKEEIYLINTRLRKSNYQFWRLIHIFCNSGSRTPEIMKVKDTDVDLGRQMVKYTIRKGRAVRIVERPIKDEVLHLWEQLMVEAKSVGCGCYLFSEGLQPGKDVIRVDQIKRRWRNQVQIALKIKKTWYALKYLNTDLMDSLYGSDITAHLNQHDKKMVEKHYAVGRSDRKNEVLKKAPNPMAIVGELMTVGELADILQEIKKPA